MSTLPNDFNTLYAALGSDPGPVTKPKTSTCSERPDPLPSELPDVPPFPVDAMPDALRPWCTDVAARMQCPPDFVAVPMLVAAASLVARHVAIRPQARTDWTEHANLWALIVGRPGALIVGRPGALKSPALREALAPIERMEREARQAHAKQMVSHEADMLAAKLRKEACEKSARKRLEQDANAHVSALLRRPEEPEAPARTRYLVNDCTYEKLGVILAENPGGTLAARDEMKSLLTHLNKEENANQRGLYVQGWSGGSYTFDRIGRGHVNIEDMRLSMLGGIQPGPLSELVRQAQGMAGGADGLLERFLIAWPDDPYDWREVDTWPDSRARQMAGEAFEAVAKMTPDGAGALRDTNQNGEAYGPHWLRFDDPAREMFSEWRNELERKLRDSVNAGMESALAKFRHHIPALALALHLIDGNQGPVCEAATLRALALSEYFEAHTRRCYDSGKQATVKAARMILARLKGGSLTGLFSARDVHQKGWAHLRDARTVTDALDMLAARRHLLESELETGGRPKTVYQWHGAANG